ncbi:hypothetical protein AALP_AA7G060100 [Arabis alpina]|uniref:Uncharacterized protein n=1 Tax=Arabis alpina TaxID=50452 RepID=A0A087GG79_ARAAL|nr:hypothetical protein AALP_AA7G060100 [Arabis alpina]
MMEIMKVTAGIRLVMAQAMDEEDKSIPAKYAFWFTLTPITAVKATHQRPLTPREVFIHGWIKKLEILPSGEERDGTYKESSNGLTVNYEHRGTESFHKSSFGEECNSCRCKLQKH